MIALTVASQKGGVGKTTISLNLAFAFAKRGVRTLLVDTDPQGAIGLSLAGEARKNEGLAEWLTARGNPEPYFLQTRLDELTLMTVGQPPFGHLDEWLAKLADGSALRALVAAASGRDLVLFDTPSGLAGATGGAIRAATHVVVPVQSEPLALRTLPRTLEAIAGARGTGNGAKLAGVLLTMTSLRSETSMAVIQEAWQVLPGDLVLQTHVPRDETFSKASAAGVPVGLLRRRPPPVASVFDNIVAELEERLGLFTREEQDAPIHLLG